MSGVFVRHSVKRKIIRISPNETGQKMGENVGTSLVKRVAKLVSDDFL